MSTLETNSIGKYSGNNVSIDDALNLKSYTTTQRDALTSVAGDTIYNTTDSKVQVYTGSAWEDLGGLDLISIDYLVVAGGASGGGNGGGGGGAGGYRNSYSTETSGGNSTSEVNAYIATSTNYTVTVGGGGAGASTNGNFGSDSVFFDIISYGGGKPGSNSGLGPEGFKGGSGGGAGSWGSGTQISGNGLSGQGSNGGVNSASSPNYPAGGGGGAGATGGAGSGGSTAGNGGNGLASSITGSSVTRGGGGGGGTYPSGGTAGSGGTGGGGAGSSSSGGTAGTANTGGGGGGSKQSVNGANGGSGVVILRFPTADATISVGAGLTSSSATDGSDTVVTFTAGTGTISFS